MNQKFLTITMCLVLSVTSAALAEGTNATAQKVTPQGKSTISVPLNAELKPNLTSERPKMMSRDEAKKQYEGRKKARREAMYKDLGLSPEQIKKADDLDLKTQSAAEPIVNTLQTEVKKLKTLKAQKASSLEVWKQENIVKAAKSKLKKNFENSNKSFEAILTKEQKVKYDARRKEMEKFKKKHKPKGHKGKKPMDFGQNGPMGGQEHMGPPPENKK